MGCSACLKLDKYLKDHISLKGATVCVICIFRKDELVAEAWLRISFSPGLAVLEEQSREHCSGGYSVKLEQSMGQEEEATMSVLAD